jgi:hypothetical protein
MQVKLRLQCRRRRWIMSCWESEGRPGGIQCIQYRPETAYLRS